jgi:hypothetical protein
VLLHRGHWCSQRRRRREGDQMLLLKPLIKTFNESDALSSKSSLTAATNWETVTWLIGCVITDLVFWRQENYYYSIRLHLQSMRWAGHVKCMREIKIIVRNPEIKRPCGRPRSKWENNIKMD